MTRIYIGALSRDKGSIPVQVIERGTDAPDTFRDEYLTLRAVNDDFEEDAIDGIPFSAIAEFGEGFAQIEDGKIRRTPAPLIRLPKSGPRGSAEIVDVSRPHIVKTEDGLDDLFQLLDDEDLFGDLKF